jgi:hypothetical protein
MYIQIKSNQVPNHTNKSNRSSPSSTQTSPASTTTSCDECHRLDQDLEAGIEKERTPNGAASVSLDGSSSRPRAAGRGSRDPICKRAAAGRLERTRGGGCMEDGGREAGAHAGATKRAEAGVCSGRLPDWHGRQLGIDSGGLIEGGGGRIELADVSGRGTGEVEREEFGGRMTCGERGIRRVVHENFQVTSPLPRSEARFKLLLRVRLRAIFGGRWAEPSWPKLTYQIKKVQKTRIRWENLSLLSLPNTSLN